MTSVRVDERHMRAAMTLAASVRLTTSPNPWVGCVIVDEAGEIAGRGATAPPGGAHAEVAALTGAGPRAHGGTAYVTLEPCTHVGRTGPCVEALIAAGLARVVVAVEDPDPKVAGRGVAALRDAGVAVDVGILADEVAEQLAPYLVHRRTGRPYVIVKLAATLDGRIAASDSSSTWITGPAARSDAHRLRAESDAVIVGAATVRADDPRLDVRDFHPAEAIEAGLELHPRRVILGSIPEGARVLPALSFRGELGDLLDQLGSEGVLQVLVEGGAVVAGRFHRAGLVDRYIVYLAPAIMGGDDAVPMFGGPGVTSIHDVTRGRFVSVTRLGDDVRLVLDPTT